MSLLGPPLIAFMAIARTKTVLSAAKELGITQTGVTQRIRSLEAQLNTTLFIRSRQGMRLTSDGESLLLYCQRAKELEGETLSKIKGAGRFSEITFSFLGPTSMMRTRIIPNVIPLTKDFSKLLVSFEISDIRSGSEALRTGQVQFAIIPIEEVAREMDSKMLLPEKYVLVCSKKWKTRTQKEIVSQERIIDFDSKDSMTQSYLNKFKLLSYARTDRHFVNNNESLLEMIQLGLGFGVLTNEFAQEYAKTFDVMILNPERYLENKLALAWYPRHHPSECFAKIIKAIR